MSPLRKKKPVIWKFLIIAILMAVGSFAAYSYYYLYPGFFFVEHPEEYRVVFGAELLDIPVLLEKEEILLPVEAVKEYLDNTLYWDEKEGRLIVTNKDKVIRMKSDHLTAYINKKDVDLHIPVMLISEVPYMPLYFLEGYAAFQRGDKHYKVWVEDILSLESRIDLAEKYGLAGVAAWRRGFESEEVWELFARRLKP